MPPPNPLYHRSSSNDSNSSASGDSNNSGISGLITFQQSGSNGSRSSGESSTNSRGGDNAKLFPIQRTINNNDNRSNSSGESNKPFNQQGWEFNYFEQSFDRAFRHQSTSSRSTTNSSYTTKTLTPDAVTNGSGSSGSRSGFNDSGSHTGMNSFKTAVTRSATTGELLNRPSIPTGELLPPLTNLNLPTISPAQLQMQKNLRTQHNYYPTQNLTILPKTMRLTSFDGSSIINQQQQQQHGNSSSQQQSENQQTKKHRIRRPVPPERRDEMLEKNREAARKCRSKRRAEEVQMYDNYDRITAENHELKERAAELTSQIMQMKELLAASECNYQRSPRSSDPL